ncbi:MAG TPA: sodium:solute symporter family protein [Candidatus Binatia bacterium]|jgi:Na+/proline symporter|nr:sodium:solute symporter family protein [Candidatus Binatia bacterium]
MEFWDVIIIVTYLAAVAGVGFWLARDQDPNNYFVTRNARSTWLTLFSVVSTNVGAATLLGVASAGFDKGISWGLNISFIVVFGFLFLGLCASRLKKLAENGQLSTLSQFYLLRYSSRRSHLLSSLLILLAYLIFISAQFRGLSQMMAYWTGSTVSFSIITSAVLMIALTSLRGIKGDMYTDGFHFVVMFVGVLIVLPYFLFHGHVTTDQILHLPSDYFNPFNNKGEVFFFGSIVFGIPVLFASMEFWQLLFSLKDESVKKTKARNLFFLAALLNAPMILIPTILGLAERLLNPKLLTPDLALIDLIRISLPEGARGLAAVSLLGAIMSTVSGMTLVASSTLSLDIFQYRLNKQLTFREKKLITGAVALIGALCASRLGGIVDQLIIGCQIIGILAPSLVGGLWLDNRFERAAFYSLIIGIVAFLAALVTPLGPNLAFVPAVSLSTLTYICAVVAISRKLGR